MAEIEKEIINEKYIPFTESMAFRTEDLITLLSFSIIWYIIFEICKRWIPNPAGLIKYENTEEYRYKKYHYMLTKPSFLHSIFLIILGSIYLYQYGFSNFGDSKPLNNFEYYTMLFSVGYFLYDFINVSILVREKKILVFHHLFTILGFSIPIIFNQWGFSAVCYVWICEISGPFFQLRMLFDYWDVSKKMKTINDLVFIATFMFCRTLLVDYFSIYICYDNMPWFYRLPIFSIQLISFVWIWEMINKFLKLAKDSFPKSSFLNSLYAGLKNNRNVFGFIWYVFAFIFCARIHLDYYEITKLGIQIIPKFPYFSYFSYFK